MARKTAALRRAFQDCVGTEDIRAVVAELIARAKAGEPWAVRELLDRSIGKPQPIDLTEAADESPLASALAGVPILVEFAAILESISPHLLPQRVQDWLRNFRQAHQPGDPLDQQLRMESLARQGLEHLRRELGDDVKLPPGTLEEQASFVLTKLETDRPASWR